MKTHDVIVIGGGPAGYTAAGQVAKAGLETLLIEADLLGGVCLNAGCIPTKTLLHSAKLYAQIQASTEFGITLDAAPQLDWSALMKRKTAVIDKLRNGVNYQMVRRRVEIVQGYGRFLDRHTLQVDDETFSADHIVIATGASPKLPDFTGSDQLLTTTDLLALDSLPKSLLIVSAGPIALGLATIFALVGVEVTLVDPSPTLLPEFDVDLVAALQADLPEMQFQLGQGITQLADNTLTLTDGTSLSADAIAFAGERQPNIHNMGLETIGLDLWQDCVQVDEQMRTNLPNIYAVGDVTGLSMWAHTAQRMGEVAANTILKQPDRFRLAHVPTVIYSEPQLATVGLSEEQAKSLGYRVDVARLPLNYNGRYLAEHDLEARGLCKVVIDANTNLLLGVHIVGGNASELIFGAAAMLADEFRVQDVQQVLFAHPTVAEVLKDTLYEL